MAEKRLYPKCAGDVDGLAGHLKGKYPSIEWDTQLFRLDDEEGKGTVFQVRPKGGTWQTLKDWTGLGIAATVTMKVVGDALEVEVGGGKWLDKAAVAGIATFVTLGVLIIPAGVGAWQQKKLLGEIRTEIDGYFRSGATALKCGECGADYAAGAKFCSECGKAVGQQA